MGERTAVIMTSKMAQKSYGTEKRYDDKKYEEGISRFCTFLCPSPMIILVGKHWWSQRARNAEPSESSARFSVAENEAHMLSPPKITVAISSSDALAFEPGQIEWFSQCGSMIGQTGSSAGSHQRLPPWTFPARQFRITPDEESTQVDGEWFHNPRCEPIGGGKCVSKQTYIQDVNEKRKRVQYLVKIHLADQSLAGIMLSKGINSRDVLANRQKRYKVQRIPSVSASLFS